MSETLPIASFVAPRSSNKSCRSAVIDGLNIIRAAGFNSPRLQLLLEVFHHLVRDGYDVLCISDANTRYVLGELQGHHVAAAYEGLLDSHPSHFMECPGYTQADPLILGEADAREAIVVSNDAFNKYKGQFSCLADRDRFIRVPVIRDHYYFRGYRRPVPGNAFGVLQELLSVLPAAVCA